MSDIDVIADNIDDISIGIYNDIVSIFNSVKALEMLVINAKISCAKLPDHPEVRALSEFGDILDRELKGLEVSTGSIKDYSKRLGHIVKVGRQMSKKVEGSTQITTNEEIGTTVEHEGGDDIETNNISSM